MKTIIRDGIIVTEAEILKGYEIVLQDSVIQKIQKQTKEADENATIISANGCYVLPGMIDIHSDMIEGFIQPRSTAIMDFQMGLKEAEKVILMSGITTMFHSISMYRDGTWDVKEIRQAPQVKKLAELIKEYKNQPHLTRHRYHLRYEIDNLACYEDVKQMIEDGFVDLVSFMDHSPGQGQYKNLEIYKKHLPNAGKDLSDQEFQKLIEAEQAKETITMEQLKNLAECANKRGISVASHDDDTVEKLQVNEELGVKISEFPITLEVAKKAVEKGFLTVLGAPNILLGGSHSGNLSAMKAIEEDAASVLVSDYYPQSLLYAVFQIHRQAGLPLWKAARFVSLNPAKAVGMEREIGSITEGKKADLIIVNGEGEFPTLQQVFVDGVQVMSCQYR